MNEETCNCHFVAKDVNGKCDDRVVEIVTKVGTKVMKTHTAIAQMREILANVAMVKGGYELTLILVAENSENVMVVTTHNNSKRDMGHELNPKHLTLTEMLYAHNRYDLFLDNEQIATKYGKSESAVQKNLSSCYLLYDIPTKMSQSMKSLVMSSHWKRDFPNYEEPIVN
ncbi:MAG: hypothetical protein WCL14_03235 [Bacteroidota bacterium]